MWPVHAKGAATEVATPLRVRLGADAETREGGSLDAGLFEDLRHSLLGILGESLVNQDLTLVEAGNAAFDDLGQGSFGLALGLGGLFGDAALGFNQLGRNVLAGEVVRGHGGDVHGNVVGCSGGRFAFAVNGEQDTNLGREVLGGLVQVSVDRGTLDAGDAADNNLLAQDSTLFDDNLGQRLAVNVGCQQGLEVGSAGLDGDGQDLVGQLDELVSLGDEVGLQLTSIITPTPPSTLAATRPSAVERPSRLVAPFRPLMRMISIAFSASPLASSRAFLTSIMPAPVRSRRALISAAV
jgi:hypothetical protein